MHSDLLDFKCMSAFHKMGINTQRTTQRQQMSISTKNKEFSREVLVCSLTSVNKFLYCTFSPGDSCSHAFVKASIDSSSFSG